MDTWIRQLLCAAVVAMTLASTPAHAQSCSDGNECTNPDMCSGGSCSGTPVAGSCDDGNPCTINDTCVSGTCQGEPNVGAVCGMTGCEGMCGPNGFCLPDGEKQGDPCTDNLGECTTDDQCIGTVCFGALKVCPDADSNPCTVDVCNFANGQCMTFGATPCGECETCDAEGGCVAANDGADCDDFNECTGSGTCNGGLCTNGAAVGTPTETGSPLATLTDTPTPTVTDTPVAEVGTPTDTPTGIPTGTTAMATATATGIPTGTTAMATATATGIPTGTATATATVTATGATATATFTATGIPTGTATATATGLPTGTATATATVTATGLPTGTATATATATNTLGGNTATVTVTRTSTPTVMIPATSTATSTRTPLPVVASIIVGTAVGAPNTTAALDVTLDTDADIAGVQVDIAYPAVAPIAATEDGKPDCTVNPEIDKDATSFAFLPSDCTPGDDCNAVRAIVLSIANLDPIPDGSRLFTCNVAISAEATGELPLPCSNAGAGNTDGDKVGADCTSGTITVAEVKDATLVVSDVVGAAGGNATVTVSLETEVLVAGTQNDLVFPAGVGVVADDRGRPACFVNPDIGKDATSFAYQPPGCTPGDDCTGVRALVLALSNVEPIPSGSVLYTCEVTIGSEVANGTYPLMCTNDGASDPDGNEVSTLCADSDVIVGVLPITPTDTPTGTPSVSPTVTPTASPTPNITPPTATPTGTPTVTGTRTHKPSAGFDDDSCQVVAPAAGGEAWLLLLPVAALLWRRRR